MREMEEGMEDVERRDVVERENERNGGREGVGEGVGECPASPLPAHIVL